MTEESWRDFSKENKRAFRGLREKQHNEEYIIVMDQNILNTLK